MAAHAKTRKRTARIQGILFTTLTLTLMSTWAVAERPAEPAGRMITAQQEMRLTKQDYRAFRLAQLQAARVMANEVITEYQGWRRAERASYQDFNAYRTWRRGEQLSYRLSPQLKLAAR